MNNIINKKLDILKKARKKEFYGDPEKYLCLDEVGDLHIQWFFDRYAALRMLQKMPIFDRAYELLTERKHFSRANSFGEMHCDGYLWIEKCEDVKVIVEERQSFRMIYIKDSYRFHIRELYYKYAWPSYRRKKLWGISISKFRDQRFKPSCPEDIDSRFGAFTYGDARDEGYILSMDMLIEGFEKVEYANSGTLSAIKSLDFWVHYLDNPSELE